MTQDLFPADMQQAFSAHAVVPAMLVPTKKGAPTRTVLCAGAGGFEVAHVTLTQGAFIGAGPDAPEQLVARLAQVTERHGDIVPGSGAVQGANEMRFARGV